MPFLTLEDPNAKIKGSRDPLGVQPVWSAFGRQVVTNLTTQTTSVRGFTVLLLGRSLAADLVDRAQVTREDALDVFLRMEQIGAYVRHVAHGVEGEIRGIERVKRFVDEHRGKVPITAARRGLILSDQKVYGLWGLYTVSARVSGLVPDGPLDVTPRTRAFLERAYLDRLNGAGPALRRLAARGGHLRTSERDRVFAALAPLVGPRFTDDEQAFYGESLRDGRSVEGRPDGRQETFRRLLATETELDARIGRDELWRLTRRARALDEGLAVALDRILHLEALIAPAAVLFQHLLARHRQRVSDVAGELQRHWGGRVPHLERDAFDELRAEISGAAGEAVTTWMVRAHAALLEGDYAEAVSALVAWNQQVMQARGGAPWVHIGEGERLDVRYQGAEQVLPARDELASLWVNSYFIDSLKQVTRQLEP